MYLRERVCVCVCVCVCSYKSWGIHMSRLTGVKSVVCIPFERRVDMEILPLQGSLTGERCVT